MLLAEIPYPQIDPVIFKIWGPIAVRWYGLAYLMGFVIGYWLLQREVRAGRLQVAPRAVGDFLFWLVVGVVVGGRLGYVLFYDPEGKFLADPTRIPKLWDGGMAFHGGLVGVVGAMVLFARRHRIPWTQISDACAYATPPGLFFGRIANFINGELWGRETTVPWGMRFPEASDPEQLLRHPSQLYEALGEGILLFVALHLIRRREPRPGILSAVFLIGYALARFVVEFFRQPDKQFTDEGDPVGTVLLGTFSMGQVLSFAMFLVGLVWLLAILKRPRGAAPPAEEGF